MASIAVRGRALNLANHGLRETSAYDPKLVDYVDFESASDQEVALTPALKGEVSPTCSIIPFGRMSPTLRALR